MTQTPTLDAVAFYEFFLKKANPGSKELAKHETPLTLKKHLSTRNTLYFWQKLFDALDEVPSGKPLRVINKKEGACKQSSV